MVLVVILLIVCLAVPLIFVIKKSLDEAKEKEQNNLQNETNNTTNNNIFSRMANDLSVIKFWIQLFAIIQIIAFIIGIILITAQCS